jgi:hypothetical protein
VRVRWVMYDLAEEITALLPRNVMMPAELKLNSLQLFVHLMTLRTVGQHDLTAMVAGGTDVVVTLKTAKFAQQGPSLERE